MSSSASLHPFIVLNVVFYKLTSSPLYNYASQVIEGYEDRSIPRQFIWKNRHYIALPSQSGTIEKIYRVEQQLKNEGIFAVFELRNMTTKRKEYKVLKYAVPTEASQIYQSTHNPECYRVRDGQQLPIAGLIKPPKHHVILMNGTPATIEKRYDGTLEDLLKQRKLNPEEQLDAIQTIFYAIANLHPNRVHGNIRPESIFYTKDKRGYRFFIGDLGMTFTEEQFRGNKYYRFYTTGYVSHQDMLILHNNIHPWQFHLARDIAAVGILCLHILNLSHLIPMNQGHPDLDRFFIPSPADGFLELIRSMLKRNYRERPDATTTLQQFTEWRLNRPLGNRT